MQQQGYDPFAPQQGGYQPQQGGYQPPQHHTNVTPIIINNQGQNNVVVTNDPFKFKTSSVLATCPACKVSANTNVTTSLSISNLCCYLWCDPLVWVIYQLVRAKDLNCCDAAHHCSACGNFISNYAAC